MQSLTYPSNNSGLMTQDEARALYTGGVMQTENFAIPPETTGVDFLLDTEGGAVTLTIEGRTFRMKIYAARRLASALQATASKAERILKTRGK